MFKRKKNFEDDNLSFVEGSSPEARAVATPKPVSKINKTVIGEHIFIEGNIRGEEHLLIEGSMKGKVEMPKHNFQVGSKGRFEGEIRALNVNINGQMTGKIRAFERVVITKDARYQGEIKTKTISLEDGAYFKGNIELDRDQQQKISAVNNPTDTPKTGSEPKSRGAAQSEKLNKAS